MFAHKTYVKLRADFSRYAMSPASALLTATTGSAVRTGPSLHASVNYFVGAFVSKLGADCSRYAMSPAFAFFVVKTGSPKRIGLRLHASVRYSFGVFVGFFFIWLG